MPATFSKSTKMSEILTDENGKTYKICPECRERFHRRKGILDKQFTCSINCGIIRGKRNGAGKKGDGPFSKICSECGARFYRSKYVIDRQFTCSNECGFDRKKRINAVPRVEVKCKDKKCNNEFQVYLASTERGIVKVYCSEECRYKNIEKGEIRECLHPKCYEIFYAPLSRTKKGQAKYCSIECHCKDQIDINRETRKHGMVSMYWQGCRCAVCKGAYSKYLRQKREGMYQNRKFDTFNVPTNSKICVCQYSKCDIEFVETKARIENGWGRFCTKQHHGKFLADQARKSREHGTEPMYNHGCRCEACRDAKSKYRNQRQQIQKTKGPFRLCLYSECNNKFVADPSEIKRGWGLYCKHECSAKARSEQAHKARKHGTIAMYSHGGCRCATCKKAQSEYQRRRYRQKRRLNNVNV